MKKFYLVMVALLLSGSMVMAQNSQNDGQRRGFDPSKMAERRTEKMAKELSLTADQKTAVLSLFKEYAPKMRPQKAKVDNGNEQSTEKPDKAKMKEMRQQMKAQRTAFNTRLQKILTPEQYKQYEQSEAQHRQKGHAPADAQNK
jgi:Spy/CpxP family protein refolding chaperone